jgi:hypothetical protein
MFSCEQRRLVTSDRVRHGDDGMTLYEWLSAGWGRATATPVPERVTGPRSLSRPRVRDGYLPLYTYLEHRYASSVVLTFEQMEALLGFALPAAAREEPGWWTSDAGHGVRDSEAWTAAKRTATPNLLARHVRFERVP